MNSTLEINDWSTVRVGPPRTVQVGEHLVVDLDINGHIIMITNLNGAVVSHEDLVGVLADLVVDRSWGMHE